MSDGVVLWQILWSAGVAYFMVWECRTIWLQRVQAIDKLEALEVSAVPGPDIDEARAMLTRSVVAGTAADAVG